MLEEYFKEKEEQWERLCIRCGACCGAFDDPCKHLKRDKKGKCNCEIYFNRFGVRETNKGEKFDCVPIKEIMHTSWKNDWFCVYKARLKIPLLNR